MKIIRKPPALRWQDEALFSLKKEDATSTPGKGSGCVTQAGSPAGCSGGLAGFRCRRSACTPQKNGLVGGMERELRGA